MRKLAWLLLTALVALDGCAQFGWVKDGITQQEGGRDARTCLRQTQQRVSGAQANLYGGFAQGAVITDPNQYRVCMVAHGYSWQQM